MPHSNDQLPSQISKTHRQFSCLPWSLPYWPFGFYKELKEHYSRKLRKLLRLPIFSWKVLRICLTFSRTSRIPPPPRFNVRPSLEKLCESMVARNKQGNLKSALNMGARGASFTMFVTDCSWNKSLTKQATKWCKFLLYHQ